MALYFAYGSLRQWIFEESILIIQVFVLFLLFYACIYTQVLSILGNVPDARGCLRMPTGRYAQHMSQHVTRLYYLDLILGMLFSQYRTKLWLMDLSKELEISMPNLLTFPFSPWKYLGCCLDILLFAFVILASWSPYCIQNSLTASVSLTSASEHLLKWPRRYLRCRTRCNYMECIKLLPDLKSLSGVRLLPTRTTLATKIYQQI